ncbi:hypothetical protein ACHAXN_007856 [Cyclotella atomus]
MQLRSPLPYMATPRHKVERALKYLLDKKRMRANTISITVHQKYLKSGSNNTPAPSTTQNRMNGTQPRFVDLGSGDGTTIFTASSLSYKSIGIELNTTLWAISSLRRLFQTYNIRNNCSFIHGDMFQNTRMKYELNRADCVMVFGVNSLMPKIADLIEKECQRGVFVMSYRFRLPLLEQCNAADDNRDEGGEHNQKDKTGVIDASLIYQEEEMRIYELRRDSGGAT